MKDNTRPNIQAESILSRRVASLALAPRKGNASKEILDLEVQQQLVKEASVVVPEVYKSLQRLFHYVYVEKQGHDLDWNSIVVPEF
jgi:hypothetical protein